MIFRCLRKTDRALTGEKLFSLGEELYPLTSFCAPALTRCRLFVPAFSVRLFSMTFLPTLEFVTIDYHILENNSIEFYKFFQFLIYCYNTLF